MIYDNIVACDEAEKIGNQAKSALKQENDNVIFGLGVMNVALEEIRKYFFCYLDSSTGTTSMSMRTS